ncbi:MAG: GNAT family N-acetyltransferase [Chitinophagaceae bacterium]|nr:GNAT family N-acetyltransferase [Chitinophagaceae bacterium]
MTLDKNIFLKGKRIGLRPLNEKDIDGNYRYWLNDSEITKYNSHGRFPMVPEKLLEYVQYASQSNAALVLAVVDLEKNIHIGNISLQHINWIDSNAEIAFLLGEKEYWGKGLMLEAGKLMLQHGFGTLNLHRIYCGTSSENTGMQKLAAKLGMVKEGIRKEAIYNNGNYYDIIEYGLIRNA